MRFLFPVINTCAARGYRMILAACRAGLGKWWSQITGLVVLPYRKRQLLNTEEI